MRDSYMKSLRDSKGKRSEMSKRVMIKTMAQVLEEANEDDLFYDDKKQFCSNPAPESADDSASRRLPIYAANGTNAMVAWRELVQDTIQADLKEEDLNDNEDEAAGHSAPLYAPPLQRQKWGDDQILPHINWGDIFFDLFYVAAAYNLGALLISSMTPELWFHGVVYFIGIFGPLFNAWESKLVYEARYTVIDYFHRLVEVVRVLFLSISVLHIKPLELMSDARSAESLGFCLGLLLECCIRIFLKSELIKVGEGDVEAIRNHSKRKLVVSYVPLAIFYLAAVIVAGVRYGNSGGSSYTTDYNEKDAKDNGDHRFLAGPGIYSNGWSIDDLPIALCAIAYVFNLTFTLFRKTVLLPHSDDFRKENVPSNIDFCIHRYGEWTMLMLGEAVLSLLIVETTEVFDYYFVALVGVITVIMIQGLHFESEPSHADNHALWRNMQAGQWYSVFLQLLSMGLIAFGVSYKVMLKGIHKEAEYAKDAGYGGGGDYGDSYGEKSGEYGDSYGDSGGYGDGGGRLMVEDTFIGGDGGIFGLGRRFLAGSVEVSDKAAAGLFCLSLTITLISLELLTNTHKGMHENIQRLFRRQKDGSGKLRLEIIFLTLLKVGLIVFLATLFLWLVDPMWVTLVGFFIVLYFAVTRVIVWKLIHGAKKHHT
eukprot:CAMPEP_0185727646 /NCGR_PEP_ID=MMETSP1171-20130828/3277_1 /TAXON_ID=374046 /ORGANISM="Helicotheca tamensis, Strain CCMP826" /LENGTH=650 /DNA_ID=CAMNT_0028396257 /DNA_START=26 /DNA_END=1978 /DNA_ORIENTATION=-